MLMGFSRDTFYRYQSAKKTGGIDALIRTPSAENQTPK